MAQLKQIKRRIVSVTSTQQITNAMKMVAAAKLRRAQENIVAARPYAYKLRDVLSDLARVTEPDRHPLLARRAPEKTAVVVVTGDRGLCGAFNQNIIRRTSQLLDEEPQGKNLVLVGRKGYDYFKKRDYSILDQYTGFFNSLDFSNATSIGQMLIDLYTNLELDRVVMVYNEFKSAIRQDLVVERLLPVQIEESNEPVTGDYLYEPTPEIILDRILPMHLNYQIWRILLESFAAEQGARMTAMESATDSASDMIQELTLKYNQARQAAITQEIAEIVSGAEAINQ